MKILINLNKFEELVLNLIKTYSIFQRNQTLDQLHYWKLFYEFIVYSSLLDSNAKLKNCLIYHSEANYDKSYEILMYNGDLSNSLYDKITSILIELEYLEFFKNFLNFFSYNEECFLMSFDSNQNFQTDEDRNFNKIFSKHKTLFLNKRSKVVKFFNLDINSITCRIEEIKFDNDKHEYMRTHNFLCQMIIDLLEEYRILDISSLKRGNEINSESDPTVKLNNSFKFSIINFVNNLQSSHDVYDYFHRNQFIISDKQIIFNKQIYDNFIREKEIDYRNTNENEKMNEKLNSIEQSLETINFENNFSSLRKGKIKTNVHLDFSEMRNDITRDNYNDYLLKLKLFNLLKKFSKNKRINKEIKIKLKEKGKIAKIFHQNLLKSRSFFGLLKWIKSLKLCDVVNQHFIEYRLNYLSKFLLKSLIYVYNRKKLIDAFSELRNKRILSKILEGFSNNLRYKITHNKLYLSQLMNNSICVEFLLKVCEVINKKSKNLNLKLRTKMNLQHNIQKLLIYSSFYKKRKVFDTLIENKNKSQAYNNELELIAGKVRETFRRNKIKNILKQVLEEKTMKNNINKFEKKLFILRFYFKKFIKESGKTKLNISKENFAICQIRRTFHKIVRVYSNKCKDEGQKENLLENRMRKVVRNILTAWRSFTIIKLKEKDLINQKVLSEKINFFHKLKLLSIEGLLTQGVVEKIKSYRRRHLLSILISTSVNKIKLRHLKFNREHRLKQKLFNQLSNFKDHNSKKFTNTIKYFLRIFLAKFYFKQITNKNRKNKEKEKIISFEKHTFFLRINNNFAFRNLIRKFREKMKIKMIKRTIKSMKKSNQKSLLESQTTQSSIHTENKIKHFYNNVFFKKIQKKVKWRNSVKNNKLWIYMKQFSKKINKEITKNALKIFKEKMLRTKYYRLFTSNVYKRIDDKFREKELKEIIKKYNTKKLVNDLILCFSSRTLENQINSYFSIRRKRKLFNSLKQFYTNKIKQSILAERYKDYLLITSMKAFSKINLNNDN